MQILDRLFSGLSPTKERGKATMKRFKVVRPFVQFAQFHGSSGYDYLSSLSPKERLFTKLRL